VSFVKIGILNNLRAGQSGKTVSRVLSLLGAYPDVMHVETDQAGALPEALAEFARRRIDLLIVNGGDGTLQHALTEILGSDEFEQVPLIAPLRGGRTNMTALDLGAQRDPVKGLASVLEAVRTRRLAERMVRRPVLRVAYQRGYAVQYGMFFGAGMIHRAIALTHRLFPKGRNHGVLGPGLVTASLIGKTMLRPREGVLTPDKVQILLDGESVPQGEFRLVIATSLGRLFLRMNPFWGSGPGPVRFTCAASRSRHFPASAPGMLRGRPKPYVTTENGYTSKNVQRAELRFDCGFTVDGEIFTPRSDETVTLTGDRRVTFVRA
jgi:hypothetical protein